MPRTAEEQRTRSGFAAGIGAYLLWGFLPLLFKLVDHVGALTVVAERTLWSLLFVGLILFATRRFRDVRAALADRRTLLSMAIAAVLLATNWLIYVWSVETGQVLEASFGYFINPLINVAIGMLFLGERQNRLQSIAIGIALIAMVIQALGLGRIPYIALSLAVTFALYGYVRKTARISATPGLFLETLVLAPFALAFVIYSFMTAGVGPHGDLQTVLLLALTGPGTAVPLLLFNFAVQRLRLTTIGMLQYMAPSIAFILAIIVFGEELNLLRAISFGLIWVSVAVFTWGSLRRAAPVIEPAVTPPAGSA